MNTERKIIWKRALLFLSAVLLLGGAGYLPVLAIPFAPVIAACIAILFLCKSRLFYPLAALTLCLPLSYLGDTLSVLCTSLIAVTSAAVILSFRIKKYLLAAGAVLTAGLLAMTVPALIYITVNRVTTEDPSIGRFVSGYVKENVGRLDIALLTDAFYSLKSEEEGAKLEKGADGYEVAASEYFSALANTWAQESIFIFLLGHGATTALLAFFGAYFLYRRFQAKSDADEPAKALPEQPPLPKRPAINPFAEPGAFGGVDPFAQDPVSLADKQTTEPASPVPVAPPPELSIEPAKPNYRKLERFSLDGFALGRKYALFVFLPASLIAFLGYIDWLAPATVAFFNALVVVPCFFAAMSLFLFCAHKIKIAWIRVSTIVIVVLLTIGGLMMSPVMLILSLFGLADAILNVRKLLNYVLS